MWLGLFLVFGTVSFVVAYEAAMHFAGVAIDGPFQLYNALRRIQAGFQPGVDFQFFHGLGVPYLHYVPYLLLGGGLRGSELAREIIAGLAYPAVFLIMFRVFTRDWRRTLCLTAAALAVSYLLRMSAVLFALNGMLGLRSALPTLIPVILYLAPTRRWRIVAGGVALGLALLLSTEQGLAVTAAFIIVSTFAIIRDRDRRGRLLEAAGSVGLAALVLVTCLAAVGGVTGMRGALRYNFKSVPMDQYWFFGSPPNLFLPSLAKAFTTAFITLPFVGVTISLGIAATVLYLRRLWREPDGDQGRRNFALAILPLYGLISCASLLGAFATVYLQPFRRVLLIIGALEGSELAARRDARASRPAWLGVPRGVAAIVIALAVWTTVRIPLVRSAWTVSLPHMIRDHAFGDARFGMAGIWPETLRESQRTIDAHRGPNGEVPALWSTYSGWIEARNGIFNPSFDYIIQALGPENREAYVAKLRSSKPRLVQTVLPSYTQYEEWLENNVWPFYDELLRWYTVTSTTPWSIFWERRDRPGPEPISIGTMAVPPGMAAVSLPPIPTDSSSPVTLLEVEVEYEIRNSMRWVPIIGPSPRYLIAIDGAASRQPVSLNPYVRKTQFPIFVRPGQKPILRFLTFSILPGASWTPRSLRLSVRPVDARSRVWLLDLANRTTIGH